MQLKSIKWISFSDFLRYSLSFMIIHLSIILGSLFVDSVSRFSETCAEHQVDEGEEEQEELGNELKDGGSYQKECSAEKEDKSEHIGALLDQDH